MPFYLCENCARNNFKPDLTLAGVNQIWLRASPDPNGFGPPCEFCGNSKTLYQLQIIGTKFDTEGIVLQKMKDERDPSATSEADSANPTA